jgi:hypothetical protein
LNGLSVSSGESVRVPSGKMKSDFFWTLMSSAVAAMALSAEAVLPRLIQTVPERLTARSLGRVSAGRDRN